MFQSIKLKKNKHKNSNVLSSKGGWVGDGGGWVLASVFDSKTLTKQKGRNFEGFPFFPLRGGWSGFVGGLDNLASAIKNK
ncbi:MAG: hypothetical protein A2046_17145 [Bacteroidetes bacterium GWA2_30_7]|nr:MAG: hypothetical protein A2046_17145 [Bacteroidetes bacterium GWA2_30_7]